ncbi:hypothetical protein [Rhizobium rhizoryzae]|uniref:hypothetical protein n=1 Tax=Rhizobium rhizoryzae TaxID=451876 RepID=UPI00289C7FDE|nr:hypothetical protein [Rhizobium rhizoryzae]
MAVDRTGDDRPASKEPKRSGGRPGRGFVGYREEWALQRTGEEDDPAVADADRAEHREAVFGQPCPIETAVDVPTYRIKGYGTGIICAPEKLHAGAARPLLTEC